VPAPHDAALDAVVFDLGGVLIDWDPRHLYRRVFADEPAMEHFLAEVVTREWNHELDLGKPFDQGVEELTARHPELAAPIAAYRDRWDEMVPGDLADTVAVLEELYGLTVPVYGLTNFSAETYPRVRGRFPWLGLLGGVVVSGEVGLAKPDPAIYRLLCERYSLEPARTLFVDDYLPNVHGARQAGLRAHHYEGGARLRQELVEWGLLPARSS
jgi:2-haloacid dehalogenase